MMPEPGSPGDPERLLTWQEASTSADAIDAALASARAVPETALDVLRPPARILLTGAGSSYYVAQSAAAVGRELTGLPWVAVPLSEAWLRPQGVFGRSASREVVIIV